MKTWIGTSGFQYPEWKGKFYPEKISPSRMLAFYAERLRGTEVNYTFRSLPSAKTINRWRDGTPEDFRFSLKAPQRVTHFLKLRHTGETINTFREAVIGLGPKLGPVLFQLPESFRADSVLLAGFLKALPNDLRTAFEFRHESWFSDVVFRVLSDYNAALCLAESNELATPLIVTADFGYFRPRRDDYTGDDTRKLAEFILLQNGTWKEAYVYYKHEESAAGSEFASALAKAIDTGDSAS